MGKMTKIALLLGALALPAYADPPAAGASTGSDTPAAASATSNALGAPADDGSAKLGAKSKVKRASSDRVDASASKDTSAKDYRVDVDASASDKDKKPAKTKARKHSATTGVKGDVGANPGDNKANASAAAGTDHAINGGINPHAGEEKVGVGASITGDDKARASSAAGANAGDRDTGAKARINTQKKTSVDTGASAGTGAGAGAEIDDTAAGSNRRP